MLTVDTIGRIRREHFLKGKTIKEIARDLRVSRNTVRKVLRSGATFFEENSMQVSGLNPFRMARTER
jgi:plasmid maintenance system antidote protein VapI